MSRYVDADALKPSYVVTSTTTNSLCHLYVSIEDINSAPSIEPNLILPEQMGRGDIYEVGETIVVMNHDDYYDLLCKSWMPKRGKWIGDKCSVCGSERAWYGCNPPFCPDCGADMREREGE